MPVVEERCCRLRRCTTDRFPLESNRFPTLRTQNEVRRWTENLSTDRRDIRDLRTLLDTPDSPSACSTYKSLCTCRTRRESLGPFPRADLDRSRPWTWTRRRTRLNYRRRTTPTVDRRRARRRAAPNANSTHRKLSSPSKSNVFGST